MLEMIVDRHLLFVFLGVAVAVGVISKAVTGITLKRLVKAAANMGKSTHPLMRLIRAKYEHACMVSDRVQNVDVFVEKYLYEYHIAGLPLHSWRRIERAAAWGCGILGGMAALGEYLLRGMSEQVLRNGVIGAALGIGLFLLRISLDEGYRLQVIRTYMVDYLDNFCARKYEKTKEKRAESTESAEPFLGQAETQQKKEVLEMEKEVHGRQQIIQTRIEDQMENAMQTPEKAGLVLPRLSEEMRPVEEKKEFPKIQENEKEPEKKKKEKNIPKEVLIREILEEYLA